MSSIQSIPNNQVGMSSNDLLGENKPFGPQTIANSGKFVGDLGAIKKPDKPPFFLCRIASASPAHSILGNWALSDPTLRINFPVMKRALNPVPPYLPLGQICTEVGTPGFQNMGITSLITISKKLAFPQFESMDLPLP